MSVPQHGSFVLNPRTKRKVKVGGRVWLNLVKQGIFSPEFRDDKELHDVESGKDLRKEVEVEMKIKELNETLPPNQQAVRGRGRFKGKLVTRNKAPSVGVKVADEPEDDGRYVDDRADEAYNCYGEGEDEQLSLDFNNFIIGELEGMNLCSEVPQSDQEMWSDEEKDDRIIY